MIFVLNPEQVKMICECGAVTIMDENGIAECEKCGNYEVYEYDNIVDLYEPEA